MENIQIAAKPGQYLTFTLKSQQFGVPVEAVKEINQIGDIAPVPHTPSYVAGVMNLRGKVIPVVDLRSKLGIEATPYTRKTCIIVIEAKTGPVGAIVDSVNDVSLLNESQIEPPPTLKYEDHHHLIMGVGKLEDRIILLIDIINTISHVNQIIPTLNPAEAPGKPQDKIQDRTQDRTQERKDTPA